LLETECRSDREGQSAEGLEFIFIEFKFFYTIADIKHEINNVGISSIKHIKFS
jgi:hypothetical protein